MQHWFFRTQTSSYGLLIARLALGIVIAAHGLQKSLGMFGGPGIDGTLGFLTGMGVPTVIAALVILGESVGSISLILGFCTRFCAAAIALIMLGAVIMVHAANGFFLPGGFEFHILALGLCGALIIEGAGALSIDSMFCSKKNA